MADFIQELFSFRGRTSQWMFWGVYLGSIVILMLSYSLIQIVPEQFSPILGFFLFVITVSFIWIQLAVIIKRWHDRDKSGFWIFICIIPIIGSIWMMIECGFMPGTRGRNKYGSNPAE